MIKQRWKRIGLALLKPRFLIPLTFLFTVTAGILTYRENQLAGLPDIGDPFDVEAFGTVDISDDENAAIEYLNAENLVIDLPRQRQHRDNLEATLRDGWAVASPEVKQWLEDNQPALEIWFKGTQKPQAMFSQPKDMDYRSIVAVSDNRSLSWLGGLQAAKFESQNDLEKSWEMHRAVVRHGHHLTMHGCQTNRMVGNALFASSMEGIVRWSNHPQVSGSMLRQAIQQLQADFQMTPPLSRTLKIEYVFDKNNLFKNQGWRDVITVRGEPISEIELFLKHEPELSRRVIQLAYQNWLSEIDHPRHDFTLQHPGELYLFIPTGGGDRNSLSPEKIEQYYQRSLLAGKILRTPHYINAHFRAKAREGILLVLLAAQAYFRENNYFPEQSTDLLDGYLDEIPTDTLSNVEEPIRYRRLANDRCLIWSVGGNHVDDGGKIERSWAASDMDYGFEIGPAGWKGYR